MTTARVPTLNPNARGGHTESGKDLTRICAVIAEPSVEAARAAMERAGTVADLIELRLDYLQDFDFGDVGSLRLLLERKPLPVIITCRASSEGGAQHVDDHVRLRLLVEGARTLADFCDVEAAFYERASAFSPDLSRLIVSYHDFNETPPNLDEVFDRVTSLPAAVHKIVTQASRITDSLAIFKLLDRYRDEGKLLIATAMGESGAATRILGPSRGSFLTYGSLATGKESAAGQLTCEELANLYRIRSLSRETGITGIIGSPVAHSASPAMHNRAFGELDLDFVYLPFEVEDVEGFVRRMVTPETREIEWNLRGFSVTIPHKTTIIPLLDELDETARAVGAVNTVAVTRDKLIGYNTDVIGAMAPLEEVVALAGERCGVIGAGGAARAVIHGLLERDAKVTIFARNIDKARPTAESFGVDLATLEDFPASDVNIVINATPLGMRGHRERESPVPASSLVGRTLAYDLVYNPCETLFLANARAGGCRTISGIEMLVAQAISQFKLWTGRKPPVQSMREAARQRVDAF